jgi:hypothetical protein
MNKVAVLLAALFVVWRILIVRPIELLGWYFQRRFSGAPRMESQNDREFASLVHAVANIRKADRATAIDVTPLLQPMLERLSLIELRDYILSRYPMRRGEDRGKKHDIFDIHERELKSFDKAFAHKDFLRIVFTYTDAWQTVDEFRALLLNDQL